MSKEEVLRRKRENSKRLRQNPEYKHREKEQAKIYNSTPKRKAAKVRNQINYERLKKYGITVEEYLQLAEKQNFKCEICGTDEPKGRGGLHVDHDHSTGKIRGLLCFHCNVGLGHFQDSVELLHKASTYLNKQQIN